MADKNSPEASLSGELSELKIWMDNKFTDLQDSNKQHRLEINGVTKKLDVIESHVFDCIVDCSQLKTESSDQKKINTRTDERLNLLEYKQNKNTLHFYNTPDPVNNTPIYNINSFIESELGLTNIKAESAIRITKPKSAVASSSSSPAPANHVIVRFTTVHDAEQIKRSAFGKPKGTHKFGVEEDLPQEWRQIRRKVFHSLVKPAKNQGKKVRWVENRLYIDGHLINTEAAERTTTSSTHHAIAPEPPKSTEHRRSPTNKMRKTSRSQIQ